MLYTKQATILDNSTSILVDMTTYADRFSEALEQPGKTVAGVADAMGVSRQAVYSIKRGQTKAATAENNAAAALYFNCDPSWLASGKGRPNWGEIKSDNLSPGPDFKGKVPLISWVQAGKWCDAEGVSSLDNVETWMDCPAAHSGKAFALRVRGDSMTAPSGAARSYPEGCIIFVDAEKRSPQNGERVVACLEDTGSATFKVYKNEDGRQWLQPLNALHDPIRDHFHVLGTVIGKWEDG